MDTKNMISYYIFFLVSIAEISAQSLDNDSLILYDGHHLIRIWSNSSEKHNLHDTMQSLSSGHVEILKRTSSECPTVDLRVSPVMTDHIYKRLKRWTFSHKTLSDNLGNDISTQKQRNSKDNTKSMNISQYNTYEEIMDWMDKIASNCGPYCATEVIGKSYEKRDLKLIRIGFPQKKKPIIWIDAGFHAREWIAPATAIQIINTLIMEREKNIWVRYLLTNYVWYILPLANPDGYSYTWTNDRLWRKTRSLNNGSNCVGTDPNRNWNFHWAGRGTNGDPCSSSYHGKSPFSEVETTHISKKLKSFGNRLKIYLTFHSYGQYWLTPWGFTRHLPPDYADMVKVALRATDLLHYLTNTRFDVGSSASLLYLAAGGSDDWVKGILGVKYAYTIELGDQGQYGFVLPAEYIDQTGEGMFSAVKTLALEVLQELGRPN